ncbi:MAG: hypothetical protein ACTSO3_15325 [Candidatus Heimdallarchaeaceae archaeon]
MSTNPINGGVKYFDQNYALFRDGASATATTNEDAVNSILDVNRYTQWESLGSNDTITETIVVTLPFAQDTDRLFLVRMNLKEFNVKWWNGATFVDFSNVVGVNGVSSATISETDYSENTAYYQFTSVNTDRIQIEMTKTQVADQDKILGQFIATEEIGTFEGFPRVQPDSNRNETKAKALSRKVVIQKTYETNRIRITLKTHPSQNDVDIVETLFDREEPFLIWPCGARTGSQYFTINQKNWRLEDIYNVQITGRLKNEYEKGVYLLGVNKRLMFEEHI